jgi:hypothetical protein
VKPTFRYLAPNVRLAANVPNLFGRERELARADQALARAKAGNGSLLLLSGEAGIGKSSIAHELASRAQASGVRVVWGRCWEAGGAMPYWPWVQVFRALGNNPFERVTHEQAADSQQERFRLLDTAMRELIACARKQPLAILLDDLHAADLPSLLLLLFLARQLSAAPLFVLGAARTVEARMSAETIELLAKVAREGESIALERLTPQAVAEWVTDTDGSAARAAAVFQRTEGNPLFIDEVLRLGALGKHPQLSDGIQAVIDEHLHKLPSRARELLCVAAVLGREFGSRDLAELSACSHHAMRDLLQQACELGVTQAIAPSHVQFQFTHVLLRDRLHDSLASHERCTLHWKAGMLAQARGADLASVAHHLLEGASAGNAEDAATSALRAAEHALSRLAFEAAAPLAERGLMLLGAAPSELACKLEIACGEALIRSGLIEQGRARCVRGAELAERLSCAHEQARAALVYSSEMTGGPVIDRVMVRLLEGALAAVGSGDSPLAAKLGARLAAGLIPPKSVEEAEALRIMATNSLAMARRIGDADTLLYVGEFTRRGAGFLLSSEERFVLTRETMALAQMLDRRLTLVKVGPSYAVSLLERGLRAEADAVFDSMVELHTALDYPQSRWRLPMLRAGFALFDGHLEEAKQQGDAALALAESVGSQAAHVDWAVQRIALAIAGAQPTSIAPDSARVLAILERSPAASPWVRGHRAWVLGAIGRRDEALATLRAAATMPQGFPTLIVVAQACVLLEDTESAAAIYEQLEQRFGGTEFFWGAASGFALGPTSCIFGDLAGLLGRDSDAHRHYLAAVELCRRSGAQPFLALSLAALARLTARESSHGRSDAPSAGAIAPASGTSAPAVAARRSVGRDLVLRREGDLWCFEDTALSAPLRLKHSKGLSYLSELLVRPNREIHVFTLIGVEHRAGDAGPVLDARAKAEYQERLESLQDQLSEAEQFADQERANRAREEIDMLASQLARAFGLGKRDRRAGSDIERARINVQRRLKDAIESIGQCDAELGRYLAAAVKTGTFCSFTPI